MLEGLDVDMDDAIQSLTRLSECGDRWRLCAGKELEGVSISAKPLGGGRITVHPVPLHKVGSK